MWNLQNFRVWHYCTTGSTGWVSMMHWLANTCDLSHRWAEIFTFFLIFIIHLSNSLHIVWSTPQEWMLPLPSLALLLLFCPALRPPEHSPPPAWCSYRTSPKMSNCTIKRLNASPGFTGTLWQNQTAASQSTIFISSIPLPVPHGYIYGIDRLSQQGKQGFMQIRLIHNPAHNEECRVC